jgi:hypothetical protein
VHDAVYDAVYDAVHDAVHGPVSKPGASCPRRPRHRFAFGTDVHAAVDRNETLRGGRPIPSNSMAPGGS